MSRLTSALRVNAGQLGVPGAVAVAVLACAAAFYGGTLRPEQQRLEALHAQAKLAAERASSASGVRSPPAEDAAAFYDYFPSPGALPDLLAKIYAAADRQAIKLNRGEYRVVRDATGRLVQYQVTFPVKGAYSQLRKFVGAALAAVPTLTLDSVRFERETIGEARGEARLQFIVYLGKTS